jgi:hypothetical protein
MFRKPIATYTRNPFSGPSTGSSTLPRPTTKATEADLIRSDKPVTTASTTSLYDNVAPGNQQGQGEWRVGGLQLRLTKSFLFRFSRHFATSKVRHEYHDCHRFGRHAAESHRPADQPGRWERQANAALGGDIEVGRHTSRRHTPASEVEVNLDRNRNSLQGLQRKYHARTSNHQQQTEQVEEHRGHARRLRHAEEDAEAGPRQRESSDLTGNGPPSLQLLQRSDQHGAARSPAHHTQQSHDE